VSDWFIKLRFINRGQSIIITCLFFALLFFVYIGISIGSFDISLYEYFFGNTNELKNKVFEQIRLPRVILAGLVGASLAISGASLQGLFRNPLADPGLIGVSAGAALGATLIIVLGSSFVPDYIFGPLILPLSAILGSALVIYLLYLFTKGFGYRGVTYMLLVGIAVNALASVGIGVLTFISTDSELRGLTFWTMGSFGAANWTLVVPAIIVIIPTCLWLLSSSRKLDLLQLGEPEAERLGVDVKKLKFKVIISSAVVVGVSVSLSGMIGFVGLVVPHLMRLLGGVNHSYLLPSSIIFGSSIMIFADLLSRILIQPAELPVGLLTSAIGAPFFLWLILRIKKA
tara:strand:- start:1918 stop:2946 length:1029 start_codon:yes stop_codon:yes gene_type:complete